MKKHCKLSVLFWLWKSKVKEGERAPIYARLTIDNQDVEMSTSKKILPEFWDSDSKTVKGKSVEAKKINSHLREMEIDLERLYNILQSNYDQIDPNLLKMLYKNPFGSKTNSEDSTIVEEVQLINFLEQTDRYIEAFEILVKDKKRSAGTLRHWKSTRRKIQDFITTKFKLNDIPLIEIKDTFAEQFYEYLTVSVTEPLAENTALKHVSKAKQILIDAKNKKIIKENPIERYSCYCDDPEVKPLEIYEVDTIYRKIFPIQRLDQARDGFIFQCFSGFAFQDIRDLTLDHIIPVGANGERWLIKKRGKTGISEMVPILPIIEELIKKYENHPCRTLQGSLIPIFSNTHYNGYLKEIANICGINKELKTHLARIRPAK